MNPSEHLTENQLNDYLGNSALDKNEKHHTGRHLLQCDFCLKRLPQPTVEQFWAALMTDNNCDDDSRDDKATLAAWLDSISDSLKQSKILVWGASALGQAGAVAVHLKSRLNLFYFQPSSVFGKRDWQPSAEAERSVRP